MARPTCWWLFVGLVPHPAAALMTPFAAWWLRLLAHCQKWCAWLCNSTSRPVVSSSWSGMMSALLRSLASLMLASFLLADGNQSKQRRTAMWSDMTTGGLTTPSLGHGLCTTQCTTQYGISPTYLCNCISSWCIWGDTVAAAGPASSCAVLLLLVAWAD